MKTKNSTRVLIGTLLSLITFVLSHGDHEHVHVPYCYDLADDPNATVVYNGFERPNGCEWAGRTDTSFRCLEASVREACPITCEVDCLTQSPSSAPSLAPTGIISCDDRKDNPKDFDVAGHDKPKRNCVWAARKDTSYKCLDPDVKWNCQVTCDLECIKPPSIPSPKDFAQVNNNDYETTKEPFPFSLLFGCIGGILLFGAVALSVRKKHKEHDSHNPPNEEDSFVKFDELDKAAVRETEGYTGFFSNFIKDPSAKRNAPNREVVDKVLQPPSPIHDPDIDQTCTSGSLCGWGSTSGLDQPQPKDIIDIEAKHVTYEPESIHESKPLRNHRWKYRPY